MSVSPDPSLPAAHFLQHAARAAGVHAVPDLLPRLRAYLELLVRWNRTVRLTGERKPERIAEYLIAPCLAAVPHVQGTHCADLGSGGGLPGLVLAAALPATRWTLIESRLKKTCFLRQACTELALANVEVVQERIEVHRPDRPYHTLTARALAKLPELVQLAQPLAAAGTRLLAWKGPAVASELAALEHTVTCHEYPVPPSTRRHRLVVMQLHSGLLCDNPGMSSPGPEQCPESSQ